MSVMCDRVMAQKAGGLVTVRAEASSSRDTRVAEGGKVRTLTLLDLLVVLYASEKSSTVARD